MKLKLINMLFMFMTVEVRLALVLCCCIVRYWTHTCSAGQWSSSRPSTVCQPTTESRHIISTVSSPASCSMLVFCSLMQRGMHVSVCVCVYFIVDMIAIITQKQSHSSGSLIFHILL